MVRPRRGAARTGVVHRRHRGRSRLPAGDWTQRRGLSPHERLPPGAAADGRSSRRDRGPGQLLWRARQYAAADGSQPGRHEPQRVRELGLHQRQSRRTGFGRQGCRAGERPVYRRGIRYFSGTLPERRRRGPRTRPRRLAWHEFARTLRFGLPVGMNWFFDFLAFSFFINVLMGGLGTTTLAALMIVIQINSVSFMPAFGIASAGAILVGQAIGASRHSDVPPLVKMTAKVVGVWQGTVGLAYLAFPALFMAPFIDKRTATPELLEIGTTMLMLSACWQLFDSVSMTLTEALRAAGDTAFSMWARVTLAWVVFVPGVCLSLRFLGGGYVGATLWLMGYIGLLAAVLAFRFKAGVWRHIDLTGRIQTPA